MRRCVPAWDTGLARVPSLALGLSALAVAASLGGCHTDSPRESPHPRTGAAHEVPAGGPRVTVYEGPPADGIRPCPHGPVGNYLASEWRDCWFDLPDGRWRLLRYDFHGGVLVVHARASSVDLADAIVRFIAAVHSWQYSEIVVYVANDLASTHVPSLIRRARWTRAGGFDALEFVSFTDR